jgi:hypothetical protein
MFDAEPVQIGFVLLQSADDFVSFHRVNVANCGLRFHDFSLPASLRVCLEVFLK